MAPSTRKRTTMNSFDKFPHTAVSYDVIRAISAWRPSYELESAIPETAHGYYEALPDDTLDDLRMRMRSSYDEYK